MAVRIADEVVGGELDCTVRGRVRGWLELSCRPYRVALDLVGHCRADLAGFRLRVERTGPPREHAARGDSAGIAELQVGQVGVFTHMEKRKELDVSVEDLLRRSRLDEPPPTPWRRAVYLEWLNEQNQRILIECTRLQLRPVGERVYFYTAEDVRANHHARPRGVQQGSAEPTATEGAELEAQEVQNRVDEEVDSALRHQASSLEAALAESRALCGETHSSTRPARDTEAGCRVLVSELFHPPIDLPPLASVDSGDIDSLMTQLTRILARRRIFLSICEHYSVARTYEWMRVHLLTSSVPRDRDEDEPVEFGTADDCVECEISRA